MTAACITCRFWQHRMGEKGECRRFPPTTIPGRATPPPDAPSHQWRQFPEHYFPLTLGSQWCGEFSNERQEHGA